VGRRVINKAFLQTYSILGILAFTFFPIFESSNIQDQTDDRVMRVEFSQQSAKSSGTVTRARPPSASTPTTSNRDVTQGPSTFSRSSRASGEAEGPVCRNRSERFQAMMDGRECDPTVAPEVAPVAPPQDPVPVVNNDQQEVVQEEPVEIVITASDLLELIPASPQILMDEGPFGLKNAHTNFYASNHRPQTVTETMFGQEVTITATPIEYRWDYGDGNSLVTDVPGHPVDVFNTETETSHQYEDTGLYTVQLTTVFEGTYQVDGGETQMVSSTVTQEADPVEIRIWRAVTRNVDQTCQQNSQAWGC